VAWQWTYIQRSGQVPSTSRRQERRNYIHLPGYDASWTGHHIAQQSTTPDCPATTSRRPGTTHLSGVHYLAAHSPATTSAAATAIHLGPTTSQPRIQCASLPTADRTALRHTVTLFSACSQHRWGRPSDITTNLGNRATATVRHLKHQ
jgi:hypothetical protein